MEALIEIEGDEIVNNTDNRRLTRRNSGQIKSFFDNIYQNYIDQSVRIKDVKFKYNQFIEYVKVVSNYEIELIHGGDKSDLKKYLKDLWKRLSKEHDMMLNSIIKPGILDQVVPSIGANTMKGAGGLTTLSEASGAPKISTSNSQFSKM